MTGTPVENRLTELWSIFDFINKGYLGSLKEFQKKIEKEHVDNNLAVRKMLLDRGIVPEKLPASEDVKKVARRLKRADAALLKPQKKKK